jgi:uncharacterized membrane protein
MNDANQQYEERFEQVLGNLLRAGVFLAAALVLLGGMLYLLRHGNEQFQHQAFHREPTELRQPTEIVWTALQFNERGIIQLGLLLLIATPVARVVISVFGFLRERDFTYVALTLIVLAVLLFSLFLGQAS